MKKKVFVLSLTLALILAFCLIVGTSPVIAKQKVIKWKMTTTWPPSIDLIQADEAFVKAVNQLCKGRLEIKFFAGGTLMPAFEVFDAVSQGSIEASGDWPGYWAGKDAVFDTLGAVPMGLTFLDYLIWYYNGGGKAIYDEAYGKFGMIYIPTGVLPMESGLRSNKPIKSLEDIKGMKIRMSGKTQGMVLKDLGAAQVAISGAEVYQALQKGVVDAAEFSIPSCDWGMGLGEVTKYWIVPGWHQPASMLGVMINKKAWDALDKDLQADIICASMASCMKYSLKAYFDCTIYTQKFIDKGIKINKYDDEVLDRIEELTIKHQEETAKDNPLFKKSLKSQIKFRKNMAKWRAMEGPFGFGFSPKKYPNLDQ